LRRTIGTTEHAQKFDPTVGIILIALLVAISVAIAASAPSGMQTQ